MKRCVCVASLTVVLLAQGSPARAQTETPDVSASDEPAVPTVAQPLAPAVDEDNKQATEGPVVTDQETGQETDEETDEEELSPEALAEIEAALAADSKSAAQLGTDIAPANAASQSMNPDISFIMDAALAAFSRDGNLQSGAHDPVANGFRLQQLELAIGKSVDPYFRLDGNIVFSNEEGVDVEEIYATTLALPHSLQARVGQFLTRFGRQNATHPHAWDFIDQPFILGKVFGGENNRGVGGELSWLTPLPWFVEVVGSVTTATGAETSRSFYGEEDLGVYSPVDLQATTAIKQFFDFSDNWSLLWGLSAATGPNATGPDQRSNLVGTDIYLKYRPVTRASHTMVVLQAEYLYRRRHLPQDLLRDHGGYAYVSWRYAQRWASALRYEYGGAAKNRAGRSDRDYLDPEWISSRHRVSVDTSFYPSEFSRLRVQGSVDDPTWRNKKIFAAMFSMEFNIGAHGAHSF